MLRALGEHALDMAPLLAVARSLRKQIDWQSLRVRVAASPSALTFFTLVQELGVAPPPDGLRAQGASRQVRVVSSSD